MINLIKRLLGFEQKWHFSWIAFGDNNITYYGDAILTVRPKIKEEMFYDIRKELAKSTSKNFNVIFEPERITILGMSRIE